MKILYSLDIANDLGGIRDDLFPSWPTIVALVIAFAILLVVLTFFLYNPVKRMYKNRQEFIKNNHKEAKVINEKAEANIIESKINMKKTNDEAAAIISRARQAAEHMRQEMIGVAKKDVEIFNDETEKRMLLEQEVEKQRNREEAASIAIEMASKLLGKDLNTKENLEFIRRTLEE